jgi:hypothetical protein
MWDKKQPEEYLTYFIDWIIDSDTAIGPWFMTFRRHAHRDTWTSQIAEPMVK